MSNDTIMSSLSLELLKTHPKTSQTLHFPQTVKQYRKSIIIQYKTSIEKQLQLYYNDQQQLVRKMQLHYERQLRRMKMAYEDSEDQLKKEIERQYTVISLMKKEVEDLLVLVNLSNMDKQTPRSSESEHLEGHYSNETDYHDTTSNTYNEHINHNNEHINYNNEHINYNRHNTDNPPTVPPLSRIPDRTTWLQIIEEQTQRTLQSSIISQRGQQQFNEQDNIEVEQPPPIISQSQCSFIKIQTDKNDQQTDPNIVQTPQEYPIQQPTQTPKHNQSVFVHNIQSSSTQSIPRNYVDQQTQSNPIIQHQYCPTDPNNTSNRLFDSQQTISSHQLSAEPTHNTCQQSPPLSFESSQRIVSSQRGSQLKDITNNNIQQRKQQHLQLLRLQLQRPNINQSSQQPIHQPSKTKQFLQQFRKTFNKCISSSYVGKRRIQTRKCWNMTDNNSSFDRSSDTLPQHKSKASQPTRSLQATFGRDIKYLTNLTNLTNLTKLNNPIIPIQLKPIQNITSFQQKLPIDQCLPTHNTTNNKMINMMLKQLDNNNKFIVGNRRLELKYDGDKHNNIRAGNGILYYSNGLCYQGQFQNNLRNGYGILKFNHIEIYNGDWKNDQLSGQGKIRNCAIINKRKNQISSCVLNRWISYCGEFRNNRFEGEGTLYLQGGEKFLGKFVCGMACGQGTIYKKNGQIQTGVWRNNTLAEKF